VYRAFEVLLEAALDAAIADGAIAVPERPACRLEPPAHAAFGDATSRVALSIARRTGRPAPEIAHALVARVHDPRGWLEQVEAAGPGFVNVRASLAFWRAALGAAIGSPVSRPGVRGRALVLRVPGGAPATEARGRAVAAAAARMLEATGVDVTRTDGPVDLLEGAGDAASADRVVVVHDGADGAACRRAKAAVHAAGGRAGRVTALGVGPCAVRHRGHTVPSRDAVAALATPSAQFALAEVPPATSVVLDLARLAPDRIDNPWVPIHYALVRVARTGPGEPADEAALEALGEADRECLRAVGRHADVVELAARRLAPDALVAHARVVAACFHRRWNGGAFATGEAAVAGARRALAAGVARTLDATLAMVDARPAAGA
jgi:arginyl-tRNA synthetase